MKKTVALLFLALILPTWGDDQDTVRVAAAQCPSAMGETAKNLARIGLLTEQAAKKGVKILVFPECAVQGYMEPSRWRSWSKHTAEDAVKTVAEAVPGPSTKYLAGLARKHTLYLCVGIIEVAEGQYYNAQVLFAPDGTIAAHHRKKSLWTPGDGEWCAPGDRPIQVVDTEYGRLGLMICYDFHTLPPLLAKEKADIILYSVGWYGPNEKNWFSNVFPRKAVIPYGFDIVVANWSGQTQEDTWPGRGHSCVITGEGKILAMSKSVVGNDIVIADLPIKREQDE
ncbi:MAG: carbon-nitrogen hydrolase family protein [Lentisphaeria bacterium]|nr:carbon-nitrogen hydrolase family protein [Lentisphaeria bacterium]